MNSRFLKFNNYKNFPKNITLIVYILWRLNLAV